MSHWGWIRDVPINNSGITLFLPEFPGLVISAIIVDWFGRKATMWILLFGCCAFLGPLAVHQKESLTTAFLFGARACGMGSSTVLCLYAPEVRKISYGIEACYHVGYVVEACLINLTEIQSVKYFTCNFEH